MWGQAPLFSCTPGTTLYPEGGHKPPAHPKDPTVPWRRRHMSHLPTPGPHRIPERF